jgi:hypothetical protein
MDLTAFQTIIAVKACANCILRLFSLMRLISEALDVTTFSKLGLTLENLSDISLWGLRRKWQNDIQNGTPSNAKGGRLEPSGTSVLVD